MIFYEIEEVVRIAEEAGELLRDGFGHATASNKSAIDLVTEYDLKSEELIRERLSAAFPEMRIVGEETGDKSLDGLCFVVDPIDGTTNFAHAHPFFAVSIGVSDNGNPVAGVVHVPMIGWTFYTDGKTAHRKTPTSSDLLGVSVRSPLRKSVVATGFPYDRKESPENNVREFSKVVTEVRGMRRCGAAAIDLAFVAAGIYEAYWEQKLGPWDACAGVALVRAAGGVVTNYENKAFSLSSSDGPSNRLIATNGLVHQELFQLIANARVG